MVFISKIIVLIKDILECLIGNLDFKIYKINGYVNYLNSEK